MSTPHSTWAAYYDTVYEQSFGALYHSLTALTLEKVESVVRPPARIVDFGAGTGRLAIPLASRGYRVTAVDPCREMLHELEHKVGAADVLTCTCTMQDFRADEPFDMALCVFTVLLYLLDDESLKASFAAAARALRPGGLLLVDVATEAAFTGYHRAPDGLDRHVDVDPIGNGVYLYQERTTLSRPAAAYRDTFPIRCWTEAHILRELADQGFSLREDMSAEFSGSGAHYFLMVKEAV